MIKYTCSIKQGGCGMNIPQQFWNTLIVVPNKESFLKALNSGEVKEFFFCNNISKNELKDLISKGWKVIKFGLNCVLPH